MFIAIAVPPIYHYYWEFCEMRILFNSPVPCLQLPMLHIFFFYNCFFENISGLLSGLHHRSENLPSSRLIHFNTSVCIFLQHEIVTLKWAKEFFFVFWYVTPEGDYEINYPCCPTWSQHSDSIFIFNSCSHIPVLSVLVRLGTLFQINIVKRWFIILILKRSFSTFLLSWVSQRYTWSSDQLLLIYKLLFCLRTLHFVL